MIINVTDHCNIQGYQYDQVSLVVRVVEEGSSKGLCTGQLLAAEVREAKLK